MPDDIKVSGYNLPIPLKIYWHEGMLLSQHLFQQNDLRNFQILSKQLSLISKYHWGIISLAIDTNELANHLFRINEIEAIFPDGLYFRYTANVEKGIKPLELKLENVNTEEFKVFISIATLSDKISPLSGNIPRFYAIEGSTVQDENLDGNSTVIPRLVPNVLLHLESELPEGCIGFPIARLWNVNGNLSLTDWDPPCFYISKNSLIWKQCAELVRLVHDKLNILNAKMLSADGHLSFNAHHILSRLLMMSASFEVLLFGDEIKPYELFKALVKLSSSVLSLDVNQAVSENVLASIPLYNHRDIAGCILPLIDLITRYLMTLDCGYVAIPFSKRERFFYRYITRQNIEDIVDNKLYIGIKAQKSSEVPDILNWMKKAVIVSDFALDKVRMKRTHGALRRELSTDMAVRIFPETNMVMFEVEINQQYIKAEQNLHIFNPGSDSKFQPKDVVLYLPQISKNSGE